MAIPLIYNVRSLRARWTSAVVAVLGIAGTVGVFVAMLSLARGFEATLVTSGSAQNAIVRRAGATSEMDSSVTFDQVRVIEEAPGVERAGGGPLVSPEVVVVAALPLKGTDIDANVPVRGVSPKAVAVRPTVKIVAGRLFEPGLTTGTLNWATFSHLAFAFRITPLLLVWGLMLALLMGFVGGVPPAIRAARARIAVALREL